MIYTFGTVLAAIFPDLFSHFLNTMLYGLIIFSFIMIVNMMLSIFIMSPLFEYLSQNIDNDHTANSSIPLQPFLTAAKRRYKI